MSKPRGNMYYSNDTCKSCGLRLPEMPFCKLTGTCVRCARKMLSSDKCMSCPSREECDHAIRGLEFLQNLEYTAIAVIPDLASVLIEYVSSKLSELGESNPDLKAEHLVRVFLALTSTLTLTRDIAQWLRIVFKPRTIRLIVNTPIDILTLPEEIDKALDEYSRSLNVPPDFIKNLFKFLLAHYMFRYRGRPISEFILETFSDLVVKALREGNLT